jgi:hypothetical protein
MPKPIDLIPGFAPQRRESKTEDGWAIYVTPPAVIGPMPTVIVYLTNDQYQRYHLWRNSGGLIQDRLPDLTPDQREQLMSGLLNDDFHRFTKDDDDEAS